MPVIKTLESGVGHGVLMNFQSPALPLKSVIKPVCMYTGPANPFKAALPCPALKTMVTESFNCGNSGVTVITCPTAVMESKRVNKRWVIFFMAMEKKAGKAIGYMALRLVG
jgi:hypothetical protein